MEELRKLAEAATPGPWIRDPQDEHCVLSVPEDETVTETDQGPLAFCLLAPQNAAYIAACSPDRILKLLDVVEKARDYLRAKDEPRSGATATEERIATMEALRTALSALDREGKLE